MPYPVCEESFDSISGEVLDVLRATRGGAIGPERNDWLYSQNPDGPAVVWTVRHPETGRMCGFTVALPRRVAVDGALHICWNGADFSILPQYRTLGVAVGLRRAAKQAIDAGRAAFLYSHPNANMQLIHERVGHHCIGRMLRYTKVLRSEEYLRRSPATRWLPGAASKTVDVLLAAASRERRHRAHYETHVVEDVRFDAQFDELFEAESSSYAVVGVRDSKYLNWRYRDNPLYRTDAVIAHDGGRVAGYALFVVEEQAAYLKDLFGGRDERVVCDVAAALISACRARKLGSISVTALEGNPVLRTLGEFGFTLRPDSSSMFGYAESRSPLYGRVLDAERWFLTVGDRDV